MHLLAAEPGAINDGSHAVDLGQTPGDIIVLSAADTELSAIAQARAKLNGEDFPSLRLASLLHLGNDHSVDPYGEDILPSVIGWASLRESVLTPGYACQL